MPIAQMSPVFVIAVFSAILVIIILHMWVFLRALHEMRTLNVRIIEALAETNLSIVRLEQAVLSANPTASDMRAKAAAVSKAMQKSGVDVESLLSEQPPSLHT